MDVLRRRLEAVDYDYMDAFARGEQDFTGFERMVASLFNDVSLAIDRGELDESTIQFAAATASLLEAASEMFISIQNAMEEHETSVVAAVDDVLRQKRAPKPQTGPKKTPPAFILSAYEWLKDNLHNPYPTDAIKTSFCETHGLTPEFMKGWFTKARIRIGWTEIKKQYYSNRLNPSVSAANIVFRQPEREHEVDPGAVCEFIKMQAGVLETYKKLAHEEHQQAEARRLIAEINEEKRRKRIAALEKKNENQTPRPAPLPLPVIPELEDTSRRGCKRRADDIEASDDVTPGPSQKRRLAANDVTPKTMPASLRKRLLVQGGVLSSSRSKGGRGQRRPRRTSPFQAKPSPLVPREHDEGLVLGVSTTSLQSVGAITVTLPSIRTSIAPVASSSTAAVTSGRGSRRAATTQPATAQSSTKRRRISGNPADAGSKRQHLTGALREPPMSGSSRTANTSQAGYQTYGNHPTGSASRAPSGSTINLSSQEAALRLPTNPVSPATCDVPSGQTMHPQPSAGTGPMPLNLSDAESLRSLGFSEADIPGLSAILASFPTPQGEEQPDVDKPIGAHSVNLTPGPVGVSYPIYPLPAVPFPAFQAFPVPFTDFGQTADPPQSAVTVLLDGVAPDDPLAPENIMNFFAGIRGAFDRNVSDQSFLTHPPPDPSSLATTPNATMGESTWFDPSSFDPSSFDPPSVNPSSASSPLAEPSPHHMPLQPSPTSLPPPNAPSPSQTSSDLSSDRPPFDQSLFEQSLFGQPSFAQPSSQQTPFAQPPMHQPPTDQLSFVQPSMAHPSFNQPSFDQPSFNQPSYNQPSYNQPSFDQSSFEQPSFDQSSFEQPSFGPLSFGPSFPDGTPGQSSFEQSSSGTVFNGASFEQLPLNGASSCEPAILTVNPSDTLYSTGQSAPWTLTTPLATNTPNVGYVAQPMGPSATDRPFTFAPSDATFDPSTSVTIGGAVAAEPDPMQEFLDSLSADFLAPFVAEPVQPTSALQAKREKLEKLRRERQRMMEEEALLEAELAAA